MSRNKMILFGQEDYHKGLFVDCKFPAEFERALDEVRFEKTNLVSCDSDLPCPYENSSAHIFLHGSCDLFAKQLRERCNCYNIYELLDKAGRTVHWYAQSSYKGKPAYIDVRGATTNFAEFLYEFKFLAGDHYVIQQRNDDMSHLGEDWYETGMRFAKNVIDLHSDYYIV